MRLEDYGYTLPESMIAQETCNPRDGCRLMVIGENTIHEFSHKKFLDIYDYLHQEDVLVLNDTKVLNAKIYGKKSTGSYAEIVLTKKLSEDEYECHIKTKNPLIGAKIEFENGEAEIVHQKNVDTYIVKLFGTAEKYLPGPPYIHKKMTDEYQTVYAKNSGSLASPTAGLHFTKDLLKKIVEKGVKIAYITLHISYGTFRNVDDLEKHVVEEEFFEIDEKAAETINNRSGRLFVVGTTALKALESSSKEGRIIPKRSSSILFIKPGHRFSSRTDVLITNFHLPKSTLLLLTCAFGGKERILNAYREAISKNYRFYSLGDAMMIFR